MRIIVIVPAFNEEHNLADVIRRIRANATPADVVVVNDNSTDRTPAVAEAETVPVVTLSENLGIGGAVQTGFKYAQMHGYDIAVQVDADGQHDPAQIGRIVQPIIENRADMVIGTRFLGAESTYEAPVARRVGMWLFAVITSFLVRQRLTDTTSGFRAINRDLIAFFARNYPIDFPDSEALIMTRKAGFRIMEVPVTMTERRAGKSSTGVCKSIYYPFKTLVSILSILIRSVRFTKEK